jgi:hypothetical protein
VNHLLMTTGMMRTELISVIFNTRINGYNCDVPNVQKHFYGERAHRAFKIPQEYDTPEPLLMHYVLVPGPSTSSACCGGYMTSTKFISCPAKIVFVKSYDSRFKSESFPQC